MKVFSLHELNSSIRRAFEQNFGGRFWVTAETSGIKSPPQGGHFYFELLEKGEREGQILARSRAVMWRASVGSLLAKFESATGQAFTNGLQVQLLVGVHFHEQFGLYLDVYDLDPTFTLGDMARKRRETLERLRQEGLIDCQKSLSLGRPLRHIAVISSSSAAGWGDFRSHIQAAREQWPFLLQFYPALMQGEGTTTSILSALREIVQSGIAYDCVVLIRGGGAEIDLMAFDSYELCAAIARYPLPIIVGIGHERDTSVADRVAHHSLKTPTAVAEFLLNSREREWTLLRKLSERLQRSVVLMQDYHLVLLQRLVHHLPIAIKESTQQEFFKLQRQEATLQRTALILLAQERQRIEHCSYVLKATMPKLLLSYQSVLEQEQQHLQRLLPLILEKKKESLGHLARLVQLLSPRQTLKRGYSIVRKADKSVLSSQQLTRGDTLEIFFYEGRVGAQVSSVESSSSSGSNDPENSTSL